MKYALVVFTSLLAALGWVIPNEPPVWAISAALGLIVLALIAEIKLERDDQKENRELRAQVTAIHSNALAAPAFELSVNKRIVTDDGQTVELRRNGPRYPLEFTIRNTGAAAARNLQVHLLAPEAFAIPHLGRHWRLVGTPDVTNSSGYAPLHGLTQYTFISPVDLNPQDWLGLGHGHLDAVPAGVVVSLRLKVSAQGGAKSAWNFSVVFA